MKLFAILLSVLLGALSPVEWLWNSLFGLGGAFLYKGISYGKTGRKQKYSPHKFDLNYWLSDRGNWNDVLVGFVLFFFICRFKQDFIQAFPENPYAIFITPFANSPFFYPVLGFLMTFIIKKLRTWTNAEKKNNRQSRRNITTR
jgi:hypothetical protein